MRFSKFLFSNISKICSRSKHKLTEKLLEEVDSYGITSIFDRPKVLDKMEKLARFQYLKNKDPKACALLYIALNWIQVLAGLFKISKNEKDKPLVGFLSRNFQLF